MSMGKECEMCSSVSHSKHYYGIINTYTDRKLFADQNVQLQKM